MKQWERDIFDYLSKITRENQNDYVKKIVEEIGHTNNASALQMKELYRVYNFIYNASENNTACGSCRQRIWTGLQRYYDENGLNKNIIK